MKISCTLSAFLFVLILQAQDVNVDQKRNLSKDLKHDNLYQNLDSERILELLDARPDLLTQANNIYGIQIQKTDILLFVSTDLRVGKLQVLSFDQKIKMTIRYTLYDFNNTMTKDQNSMVLDYNRLIDIDNQSTEVKDSKELDFKWGDAENPTLFPQNNITICLLNESRTKH